MVLHEVGALLFDLDRALLEDRIVASLVLLLDRLDGLRLDARLRGVVHAAREVAVRMDAATGLEPSFHDGGNHSSSFKGRFAGNLSPRKSYAVGPFRARAGRVAPVAAQAVPRGDPRRQHGAHAPRRRVGGGFPEASTGWSGRRRRASGAA